MPLAPFPSASSEQAPGLRPSALPFSRSLLGEPVSADTAGARLGARFPALRDRPPTRGDVVHERVGRGHRPFCLESMGLQAHPKERPIS